MRWSRFRPRRERCGRFEGRYALVADIGDGTGPATDRLGRSRLHHVAFHVEDRYPRSSYQPHQGSAPSPDQQEARPDHHSLTERLRGFRTSSAGRASHQGTDASGGLIDVVTIELLNRSRDTRERERKSRTRFIRADRCVRSCPHGGRFVATN